ncbi:MAG: outer membrane beta-barrel protein [Niabella sp.]|nr:outer membrane beta-barrel protein [Niabella sp.]
MSKFTNMTDEELDKLFRDAADRFQPPDAPEGAWEAFYKEKLLQEEQHPIEAGRPFRKKILAFLIPRPSWQFAASCLFLVLAAWFFLNKEKPTAFSAAAGPGNTAVGVAGNNSTDSSSREQQSATGATAGIDAPVAVLPAEPARGESGILPHKEQVEGFITNQESPNFSPGVKGATKKDSLLPRQQTHGIFSLRENQGDKENKPAYHSNPQWTPQTETANNSGSGGFKWQIGVQAGSNLGMVKGDVSKKPGVNAGVVVQRKLGSSRFSLESGVMYESMTYAVNNTDFTPNGYPVSSKVSNIEGSCSMIDVPVNVRYDVVASKKNKAFISTGVSPTMIVKQSYVYDYDKGDGPARIDRDVSGKGNSVYAVANLSIGYEQKWNHVSVQIAPYVKIPMGEIGYGNLSLGGIGTQISIKKDL